MTEAGQKPWCKGKDIATHKWVYGTRESKNELFQENKKTTKRFLVDPKSVSRSTGLKDINKKGVYEGDIVEVTFKGSTFYGLIKFSSDDIPYFYDEEGQQWTVDQERNTILLDGEKCDFFESFIHCYDHYGPNWNDKEEE